MENDITPENGPQDEKKPELAFDFDFTPDWARKPPENPYASREDAYADSGEGGRPPFRRGGGGGRFRRDDSRGGFRRDGADRREGGRREGGFGPRREDGERRERRPPRDGAPAPRDGFRRERPDRPAGERRPHGGGRFPRRDGERREREPLPPRLDVKVSFLPDRERLALVVRDIQASRRAFPLVHISNLFLAGDDRHQIKMELPPPKEGEPRKTFVQCLDCHRVFLARANAENHVLNDHIGKFFDIEEVEVEPPSGTYTCVARCKLSGELLGPPNDHSYNAKLQELWSTRFSHMPKSEYLSHIETVRDEALVEQWKDSMRKKTVYRLKAEFLPKPKPAAAPADADSAAPAPAPAEGAPAPDEAPAGADGSVPAPEAAPAEAPKGPAMTKAEAQDWMRNRVKNLLRESPRCMLPGTMSRSVEDPSLRHAISWARGREARFPITLTLALRPAFRHMGMHLFKINARETYVTAVAPVPVDLATAPDIVKEIVAFLEANPAATRQTLLDGLRPGADAESKDVQDLLRHLDNLVANGNVIAFHNGTLGLPRAQAEKPKAEPEKPADAAEPAEPAASAEPPPPRDAEAMAALDGSKASIGELIESVKKTSEAVAAAQAEIGDLAARMECKADAQAAIAKVAGAIAEQAAAIDAAKSAVSDLAGQIASQSAAEAPAAPAAEAPAPESAPAEEPPAP